MGLPTLIALCYQLILLFVFVPLHVYWLWKWSVYQNHFVIRHRFPKISIAAFVIACLVQISTIIFTILGVEKSDQLPLTAVNMALTFLQEGLIFYRVHLLYIRYKTTSSYLTTMMQSHSSTDKIVINQPKKYKYHAVLLNILLIFIVIGTIITGVSKYIGLLRSQYLFLVLMLSGIIIVANTLRAKVKESIACVQESVCTVSMTLAIIAVSTTMALVWKTREQTAMFDNCSGFTLHVLIATFVLYIPLRLINKVEPCDADKQSVDSQSTISTLDNDPRQNTDSTIDINASISHMHKTHVRLMIFLKHAENYKVFAQYLSQCFALESLLFCERVLVLYHIILKYKKMDTQFMNQNVDNIPCRALYELEFDYLSDIYIEMDSTIQNEMVKNDRDENEDMTYKKGILSIISIIYKQFCCDDSPTQINVPSSVYSDLHRLFLSKEYKEISDQFDSYDKLLWIFDDALRETWAVCQSVYSFRFRLYLENAHKVRQVNE